MGFAQILDECYMDDQDIREEYWAGYIMAELNAGRWLRVMPGVRYEQTDASMKGFYSVRPQFTGPIFWPLPGSDTSEVRSDVFWLPMIHVRILPMKSLYLHLSYTNTLGRPDFNWISPNYYLSSHSTPFIYRAMNPYLKTEFWENYDIQLTLHGNKIGLFGISGFYKTVRDKIWFRSFRRLATDPPVPYYPENAVVNVSWYENHGYDIYLQGVELEWQTSFWFLPGFLRYFTLNANYTYTESKTQYPTSRFKTFIPEGERRPVTIRIDSTSTGPMRYQPKHIANVSLGYNYKRFNTWLSFQYNGKILTSKNYYVPELDRIKESFYRLDLQMTYDLPLKIPGRLQILGNFANLSNYVETQKLVGDPRYTYQEKYGWTADLGIRYRF
jgi:TonB-dependent receptor